MSLCEFSNLSILKWERDDLKGACMNIPSEVPVCSWAAHKHSRGQGVQGPCSAGSPDVEHSCGTYLTWELCSGHVPQHHNVLVLQAAWGTWGTQGFVVHDSFLPGSQRSYKHCGRNLKSVFYSVFRKQGLDVFITLAVFLATVYICIDIENRNR